MPKTRTRRRSFDNYLPIQNPINPNSSFSGQMFETYDAEYEFVRRVPIRHLWTIVDGEGSSVYICAGAHYVNRLGYLVTEHPWENDGISYKG